MYGATAERMKAPKIIIHDEPPPPKLAYVEECTVDFRKEPKGVKRQTAAAQAEVATGDAATASAETLAASSANARIDLIVASIGKYSDALRKDPYNAEATLKLALAYDKVLRKGCALALLKRLGTLAENPKFAKEAESRIDAVTDNPRWFTHYRPDAISALGR
jgi:hypothetical protein